MIWLRIRKIELSPTERPDPASLTEAAAWFDRATGYGHSARTARPSFLQVGQSPDGSKDPGG